MTPPRAALLAIALAIGAVAFVQQAWVSPTNFGGADEWLLLDLSSRGILGIPYANRPLVLLWQAAPAHLLPGDLRVFWLFTTLYFAATGALTAWLALRLAPGEQTLALLAGVATVAWAPLDYLRLDSVLICGYAGFTLTSFAAVVLFVEAWHRKKFALLAAGMALALVATLGVESVLPVLVVAPFLIGGGWRHDSRRFRQWTLAWMAVLAAAAGLTLGPLLLGWPSYQTGALGIDPSPLWVGGRVLQLAGMQVGPLLTSPLRELAVPAVPLAVLTLVAGLVGLRLAGGPPPDPGPARKPVAFVLAAGVLLTLSAHATLALTPAIRTPARTQILSAPGLGLALAATIAAVATLVGPRWRPVAAAALGAWVVAVGTGRVVAMQAEWDTSRSLYPAQAATLSALTRAAPGLEPGSLVLLLDDSGGWPMTFTFRHALRYLYGDGVVGVVRGGADFLYPWRVTGQGIVVEPWPVIRAEWQVAPTLHAWDTILVVHRGSDGRVAILPRWPDGVLAPLPAGARYAPQERIRPTPVRGRERRVLTARGPR
jgi:hypothetical protein